MKPLILILLVSISAEAQNLADTARQERARQAQYKSTRVFSDANAHLLKPITPAEPLLVPLAGSKELSNKNSPAATAALNAAGTAAAAAPDPIMEEMQKLRIRVRALEDQETALKLQIFDITNQVYAPLTDNNAHNEALTKLGETQSKLADVQRELGQTRINLQQAEIQANSKK